MLERVLWFVTALVLLVLGFFFLAVALVVGAVLAAVLFARIWWVGRKLKKAADDQVITTDYTVVEREILQERLPNVIEGEARRSEDDGSPLREERTAPPARE